MRFLNAIGFLTIIKIPSRFYLKQEEYYKTLVYFPAVGFLIGFAGVFLFFSLNFIFPIILICIVLAGFEIIITGAIHVDGLADTFDGAFSGETDKTKIITIMKKGDIGVFGVIALIFSLAIKVLFYYFIASKLFLYSFAILENGLKITGINISAAMPGFLLFASILAFTPVFGRLVMLYLFSRFQPAVKSGSLTNVFKHRSNRFDFAIALIFSSMFFLFISILAKINILVPPALNKTTIMVSSGSSSPPDIMIHAAAYAAVAVIIIALTMLFAVGTGKIFTKKIGGLSGDIIGAVCVLSEVFFLFLNYISISFLVF